MACFLDSMGPFAHVAILCLRELSKSLNVRGYTWYVNLKLGLMRDFKNSMSMFNTKFFYA